MAPGDQALVGFVGYQESPAPSPAAASAMPMVTGGARSLELVPAPRALSSSCPLPAWMRLPVPSWARARGSPRALLPPHPKLPPTCLPMAPGAGGFKEAVFPFLLPLCSISVGPRTSWAPPPRYSHRPCCAPACAAPGAACRLPAFTRRIPALLGEAAKRPKSQEKPPLPF